MPRRNYILEQWNDFARNVLPPECSEIQRSETRRAFFAGAVALWGIVFKNLSPDSEPTEQDLQMMSDLSAEFDQHVAALRAGTR